MQIIMTKGSMIVISPDGSSKIIGMPEKIESNKRAKKIPEVAIEPVQPLFSIRKLAEYFDCYTEDGKPASETILGWWHSGRIPPPDFRISRKAVYWKPETIEIFINNGGSL
jgi:hypothetical protein